MAIASVNPATGAIVATFQPTSASEIDSILGAAERAQRAWREAPLADRATRMRAAAKLLRDRAPELAKIMAIETGKPVRDGDAEAKKCALACDHYAQHAAEYLAPREVATDASKSYVRYDPLGVVLAVMPWNFPFWQVFRFVAPNLMAGNGGVLKHAANVPQCALAIEALLAEAGFPKDLFRALLIESEAVGPIIDDPRIAAATLTGSEGAGRAVGERAGRAIKPVVLELGGSDAFIVLADADLEDAAKTAAAARTINSGQSCIAAKRFIVDAKLHDRFVELMANAMRALVMGDPLDPATQIGPQARVDLRDALHGQVTRAIAGGARKVLGCEVPSGAGAFYPPSILTGVGLDNVAAREELFGPVAAVMKVDGDEEAIAYANHSTFGLGASVWTRDRERAERLVPRIEAGSVFVNGLVKSDPRLPFGGVKHSGVGRELGPEGARAFVNAKTVWIR